MFVTHDNQIFEKILSASSDYNKDIITLGSR